MLWPYVHFSFLPTQQDGFSMEPVLRSPPFLALFLDPFGDRIQPSAQPIITR